jgi:hypothetical protein
MENYILANTHYKSLKDQKTELAVLPWGATEAHNYHLPYATDNFMAEKVAAESARFAWENGGKVIVLPAIPFGVNTGQLDIRININLNPSTQFAILSDIADVLNRHEVYKRGRLIDLPLKEFELLSILIQNKGRVLTRELLLEKVWGFDYYVETRTVDVHIRYLRQKIEDDDSNPVYIETIRGIGYKFSDREKENSTP